MFDDFIKQFEENGADGVDFIPIYDIDAFPKVLASYTREDFEKGRVSIIPRSNYRFWKMVTSEEVPINYRKSDSDRSFYVTITKKKVYI